MSPSYHLEPALADHTFCIGVLASIGSGYVVASGRGTNDSTWFVIDHSTVRATNGMGKRETKLYFKQVTAASGYSLPGKVYLGRPWGKLARVIYQHSNLTVEINPLGWHPMTVNATP